MQIIQEKGNMKIYFVIDIYEKLNLLGYMNLPLPVKMGLWFYIFHKTNFENSKKKKTGKH